MRRSFNIVLAAATTFMLLSCDTLSGFPPLGNSGPAPRGMVPLYGNPVSGTGTLLVKLTDAPADYAKVLVTISEVAVHRVGALPVPSPSADPSASPAESPTPEASPTAEATATPEASASPFTTLKSEQSQGKTETSNEVTILASAEPESSASPAAAEEESGWIRLAVTLPMPVDLLTLKDSLADLGLAELPAGKYTQIRLKVTRAQVELKDGSTHEVKIPSGTLKLVHPVVIEAGAQTQLTLDFDAEKSVYQTGKGSYQMKPTIKVVATQVATPTASPSPAVSAAPTASPDAAASAAPSAEPTAEPSAEPSAEPTAEPSPTPEPSPSETPAA